jgi:hypothetical protein
LVKIATLCNRTFRKKNMRGERVKRTKWRDKKSERDDGEKKFQR